MVIGRKARGYEEADEYHDIDCLVEACILSITQYSADWQVLQIHVIALSRLLFNDSICSTYLARMPRLKTAASSHKSDGAAKSKRLYIARYIINRPKIQKSLFSSLHPTSFSAQPTL